MTKPIILVSNDDGAHARGLRVLADALEALGDVWVVAPEGPRSASGHSISLHKPLRLQKFGDQRFACSGTPTDCVYIAFHHVLPRTPDLVVSGINHGANLGDDVTYSGTVGAAMEGMLMGAPALAVSLIRDDVRADYDPAALLAVGVAQEILERGLPEGTLLNLNVPNQYDPSKGIVTAELGKRNYGRLVVENHDPRGLAYYWIGGPDMGFHDVPMSDGNAAAQGLATLTPLHLDLTNRSFMRDLADWQLPHTSHPDADS